METYWCTQKNSIIALMNGKKLPLALTPCLTSACTRWREGECIHIRAAGKPERPQVFSRQGSWVTRTWTRLLLHRWSPG